MVHHTLYVLCVCRTGFGLWERKRGVRCAFGFLVLVSKVYSFKLCVVVVKVVALPAEGTPRAGLKRYVTLVLG